MEWKKEHIDYMCEKGKVRKTVGFPISEKIDFINNAQLMYYRQPNTLIYTVKTRTNVQTRH
jgi:hypothetical protein